MTFARAAVLAWAASALLVGALPAFADDCTDSGDCAMAPRNIDAATGVAAAGPFAALAWLYLRRRGGLAAPVGQAEPRSADELARDLEAVKEEFERLQAELRDQALNELRNVDEFMKGYDDKWREAMFALEDYLREYENLLPGLQNVWEQFGNREDARRLAEAADELIMLTQMGVGLARSAASTATREALGAARRAGTRAETDALRRAAREALGKDVQALQAAERAAARRAAQAAEREVARKAEEAALERAMDQKIADLAARQGRAEKDILEQIKDINPTGHTKNCAFTSHAVEEGLAGRARIIAIPEGPVPDLGTLERIYGQPFVSMGNGAQGKAAVEQLLARNPNARGLVRVEWLDMSVSPPKPKPVGHVFNAVNKDGFILFPDGQSGRMISVKDWSEVGKVIFLRTN